MAYQNGPYKNKQQVATPRLRSVLFSYFRKALFFPKAMASRYNGYNGSIREIIAETKDGALDRIRQNNNRLVNFFIRLPLFVGFAMAAVSTSTHWSDYDLFYRKLATVSGSRGFFGAIGNGMKRMKIVLFQSPCRGSDVTPALYGYLASFMGACFLSLNPAFKEERKISSIFVSMNYLDQEGRPWGVTWTPDAIMIRTFGCDHSQFWGNAKFWSSINFQPSPPKESKKDMSVVIYARAYELPHAIHLTLSEKA